MGNERDYSWAITALANELRVMEQITDRKIGKPGSPYAISMIRIASILNGAGKGYFHNGMVFHSIRLATCHLGVPERTAMRVFTRALKMAYPRFPENQA